MVEIQQGDQLLVQGKLIVDDAGFDGEDEYPIFGLIDAMGGRHDFVEASRWRFLN